MSFLGPKPEGLSSSNPERTESRFSGPVPFPHGTHRLALRHIEHPWNYRTQKTGSNGQDDADYYSVAGWVCLGVVHSLRKIFVNGRPFHIFRDNPEDGSKYLDLEIPYYVPKHFPIRLRFYWGYDDQAVEPLLNGQSVSETYEVFEQGDDLAPGDQTPDGTGKKGTGPVTFTPAPNNHPPYGGICYAVFYSLETGFPNTPNYDTENNRWVDVGGPRSAGPSMPNIEFEIYRRPTLLAGNESVDGVNPVAVNYDYLTDPRAGLGLPDSIVPQTSWQAGVNKCAQYRWEGLCRLAPMLNSSTTAATAISKVNSYFGGLLIPRDGQLLPDIIPELGDADFNVWIQNSGFDTEDSGSETFEGWTNEGPVTPVRDTAIKYEGEASCRFDVGGTFQDVGIYQDLPTLTPGKTYLLEIIDKTESPAGDLGIKIGHDTDWGSYGTRYSTSTWGKWVTQFTAVNTGLHIHIQGSDVNNKVWIDSLSIREAVTELTRNDLAEDPELSPLDSDEPVSESTVKYLTIDDNLEDDSITERISMPSIIRGEPKTVETDGEFCRKASIARLLALRVLAGKNGSGRIKPLRNKGIRPDGGRLLAADVVKLDYSPWSLDVPLRIREVSDNGRGRLSIKVDVERGLYPQDYDPAEDTRVLPPEPSPDDFVHLEAIELPIELGGNRYPARVAILGQRENSGIFAFDVYMTTETDGPSRWQGEEILRATLSVFGVHGTLNTAISDSATSLTLDLDSTDYDHLLAEGFTEEEVQDNTMLALIGSEWISLGALTAQSGSLWTFDCLRGRAASTATGHALNDEIWIVRRNMLVPLTHDSFLGAPMTVWWKAVPKTIAEDGNASAEFSLQLQDPKPGNVTGLTATFDSDRYYGILEWTDPTDNNLDLLAVGRKIDSGDWKEIGRVEQGVQYFEDKHIAGVGGNQTYTYRIRAIDEAKNESDSPWPEDSITVPEAPTGGLPSIAQPVGFQLIARGSLTAGKRFYVQWDASDGAFLDRMKITYHPTSDEDQAQTLEVAYGTSGTKTVDLPITSKDAGNGTSYTAYAQRGDVENGITFWSIRVADTATMDHYDQPPSVPTIPLFPVNRSTPTYESEARRIVCFFEPASDDDLKHTEVEININDGAWEQAIDPILGSGKGLIYGDPERFFIIQDMYPEGSDKTIKVRIRSVDFAGNESLWINYSSLVIPAYAKPPTPTGFSVSYNETWQMFEFSWTPPATAEGGLRNITLETDRGNLGSNWEVLNSHAPDVGYTFWPVQKEDAGITYGFRISSYDQVGQQSTTYDTDTAVLPALSTVSGFSVSNTGLYRSALVEWTKAVPDEGAWIAIQFYDKTDPKMTKPLVWVKEEDGEIQVDDLLPGSNRYFVSAWRVTYFGKSRQTSAAETQNNFTVVEYPAPGAVTGLTATPERGGVRLAWSNPSQSYFEGIRITKRESYDWSGGSDPQSMSETEVDLITLDSKEASDGVFLDTQSPEYPVGYEYKVYARSMGGAESAATSVNPVGGVRPLFPSPHIGRTSTQRTITSVSIGSNLLTISGSTMADGTMVRFFSRTDSLPGGVEPNEIYYVEGGTIGGTYYLHRNRNLISSNRVDITSSGSGTKYCWSLNEVKATKWRHSFTSVALASDEILLPSDTPLEDGGTVRFSGSDLPAGLTAGQKYWANKSEINGANYWSFYSDPKMTLGINITDPGSGTRYCIPQVCTLEWFQSRDEFFSHTIVEYYTEFASSGFKAKSVAAGTELVHLEGFYNTGGGALQIPTVRVFDSMGISNYQLASDIDWN